MASAARGLVEEGDRGDEFKAFPDDLCGDCDQAPFRHNGENRCRRAPGSRMPMWPEPTPDLMLLLCRCSRTAWETTPFCRH